MSVKGKRVGFIGGGNMGEALIKGLLGASLVPPDMITATDVRTERASQLTRQFGITAHGDNARCVRDADVVILAVKPQIMAEVLRAIAPAVGPPAPADLDRRRRVDEHHSQRPRQGRAHHPRDAEHAGARARRAPPPSPRARGSGPTTSAPRKRSSAPSAAWSCSTRS